MLAETDVLTQTLSDGPPAGRPSVDDVKPRPAGPKLLRGRDRECEALDRLLAAVRDGQSRALVVRGEPGVGKTALLEYVVERAPGRRVARAAGVQAEIEFPFAGLHQLCMPMLHRLDALPEPQRDALRTAFGQRAGDPPDRFLIGLAVLSLLATMAEEQPLVCVIDDAQWLDRASAQALAFVARRLLAESVALVFAVRDTGDDGELTGLPELVVDGLREPDARALLNDVIGGPIDELVRDRIVAETGGNPLALLELPRGLTSDELAGGFGIPAAMPLSRRIEERFRQRVGRLPAETRQLLLIAAAEPVGDPAVLWRAAGQLGISVAAAAPAEADGLLKLGGRVTFHHPLVRSAIYRGASPEDRRSVHRALAEATDSEFESDRRAWHRAQAATGPDDEVAEELEHSADRAMARGGLAAAAAFLERAAGLTVDPGRRAERALAAARAKLSAGAPNAALEVLATVETGPLDELQSAYIGVLHAEIAFAMNRGSDAPPLLLKAAKQLEPLNAELARETYLDALATALVVGRLSSGGGVLEAAQAARAGPPSPEPPRPADLLLDGLALLVTEGYTAGVPTLKRALIAFRSDEISRDEGIRWLSLACTCAMELWDDEGWHDLAARQVRVIRDTGALNVLPIALANQMGLHLHAGERAAAALLIEEMERVAEATGGRLPTCSHLALAAWHGREAEALALIEGGTTEMVGQNEGRALTVAQYLTAMLYNGLGRYEQALAAAKDAVAHPEELGSSSWALAELVEAAARTGNAEIAADALERLSEMARATGTDWALGVEARSRALVSDGEVADGLYREAIERLGRTRVAVERARAHLVYGEWLRRERRRLDAREQLRTAHETFATMGMEAFAERAARELRATGETARKRTVETTDELTAQEGQIAALARDGLSNPEIGAQLFISPRTVEYHLHKVFGKLGIRSRSELERVLSGDKDVAVA
jgi:DNA-binding CsgD family transcriptional regulator